MNLGHNKEDCPLNANGSLNWTVDKFIVVNSVGIFVHTLKWCDYIEAATKDKHLQLLQAHLFLSTMTKPQTAFTFAILDEFLIAALECKTSA